MALAATAILAAVQSHALASGLFERVNQHEPKDPPGNGLTAAVWVDTVGPVAAGSGLQSTTGLVTVNVRLYLNMISEPQDAIDPVMVGAVDTLLAAYSGDFELGGQVRNIDLLGAYGPGLSARAGYLPWDGKTYRVYTITLPMIVNDMWTQAP